MLAAANTYCIYIFSIININRNTITPVAAGGTFNYYNILIIKINTEFPINRLNL